jgi:hypothetical protein
MMPPLPDSNVEIADGALGLIDAGSDGVHLKIGVANSGTPLTIYSFSGDDLAAKAAFSGGPLLESVVASMAEGAPVTYAMPVTPSVAGTVGAVTRTGTGTSVLDAATSAPKDTYEVLVKITRAAANLAAATAAFELSLDGGDTWTLETAVPVSGVISSSVPNTGLVLTFGAGTFVVGDVYSFKTTAPALNLADINAALDAALADPREWRFVHIVGASSGTIAVGVGVKLQTAKTLHRYTRAILEARDQNAGETYQQWQTAMLAEFTSVGDGRIAVIAAPAEITSPVSGQVRRSSAAGIITGRIARRPISEDLGRVRTGPLAGVKALYHDERKSPSLDAAQYITLRTHIGRAGVYATQGLTLAPTGSDFKLLQNGFVMDKAAKIVRDGTLFYLNDDFRVDPITGFIDEVEAQTIEADLRGKLTAGLLDTGDISDINLVEVKRNNNILSSGRLFVKYRITPLAYGKFIENELSFVNPALVPQVPAPAPGQQAGGEE